MGPQTQGISSAPTRMSSCFVVNEQTEDHSRDQNQLPAC